MRYFYALFLCIFRPKIATVVAISHQLKAFKSSLLKADIAATVAIFGRNKHKNALFLETAKIAHRWGYLRRLGALFPNPPH